MKVYWINNENLSNSLLQLTIGSLNSLAFVMMTFVNIFLLAHKTGDVKLQSFQNKVLNRICICNNMLTKWGITDSVMCDYYNDIDTLEHYFFYWEQYNDICHHTISNLDNLE